MPGNLTAQGHAKIKTTAPLIEERLVRIAADPVTLDGSMMLPEGARAIVVFVQGSGGSPRGSANYHLTRILNEAKLATLFVDFLTAGEKGTDLNAAHPRSDVGLVAERLVRATDWLKQRPDTLHLAVGYLGAGIGAAHALVAATKCPDVIGAIVSLDGRPGPARRRLPRVRAPTLLIVGGENERLIEVTRMAMRELRCDKQLAIVPGSSHSFEEPGAPEQAAQLAREWFERYLVSA